MTAVEAFSSHLPPCELLATDLDTAALAKGEQGVYTRECMSKLDAGRMRRFFLPVGPDVMHYVVRPELRALVTCRRLNLLDAAWPLQGPRSARAPRPAR